MQLPALCKLETPGICSANQAGENGSSIFTACVRYVPRYHFKFACEILQMAVKQFLETHF